MEAEEGLQASVVAHENSRRRLLEGGKLYKIGAKAGKIVRANVRSQCTCQGTNKTSAQQDAGE